MATFTEKAVLTVVDQASKPLSRINKQLAETEKSMAKLQRLQRLSGMTFGPRPNRMRVTRREIDRTIKSVKELQQISRQKIDLKLSVRGFKRATRDVRELTAAYQQLTQVAGRALPAMPRGGYPRGGPSRPGAWAGYGWNRGPFGSRGYIGNYYQHTQFALARHAHQTMVEGGRGFGDASTQRTLTKIDAGYQKKAIYEGAKEGVRTFRVVTEAGLIEQMRQLASQMLAGETRRIGVPLAKLNTLMALNTGSVRAGENDALEIVRALDAIGRADDAGKFTKASDAVSRGVLVAGRKFNSTTFGNVLRMSGRAKLSMNDQALTDLAILVDEYKRRAGDMIRQGLGDLGRPNLSAEKKAAMAAVGLRNKDGSVRKNLMKEAATNFVDFSLNRIKPMMQRLGVSTTDDTAVRNRLAEMGFNEGASRLFAHVLVKEKEILAQRAAAARKQIDNARLMKHVSKDVELSLGGVRAAWKDAVDAGLKNFEPLITGTLNSLSGALTKISESPVLASVVGGVGVAGYAAMQFAPAAALLFAGRALTKSAAALAAAAGVLTTRRGLNQILGMPNTGNLGKAGAAAAATRGGLFSRLKRFGLVRGASVGLTGLFGANALLAGDWSGVAGNAMMLAPLLGLIPGPGWIAATVGAAGFLLTMRKELWEGFKWLTGTSAQAQGVGDVGARAEQAKKVIEKSALTGPTIDALKQMDAKAKQVRGKIGDVSVWRHSIVDLTKLMEMDSSFAARRKLAAKYGIKHYRGTAVQNARLIRLLLDGAKDDKKVAEAKKAQVDAAQAQTVVKDMRRVCQWGLEGPPRMPGLEKFLAFFNELDRKFGVSEAQIQITNQRIRNIAYGIADAVKFLSDRVEEASIAHTKNKEEAERTTAEAEKRRRHGVVPQNDWRDYWQTRREIERRTGRGSFRRAQEIGFDAKSIREVRYVLDKLREKFAIDPKYTLWDRIKDATGRGSPSGGGGRLWGFGDSYGGIDFSGITTGFDAASKNAAEAAQSMKTGSGALGTAATDLSGAAKALKGAASVLSGVHLTINQPAGARPAPAGGMDIKGVNG